MKLLKTEEEYQEALDRLYKIFHSPEGTNESDEADLLALLVEDYETKNYPIDPPDPIEKIKFRMEQMGLKQADLIEAFGGRNRASEVLNKKRRLTIDMIRKLSKRLNIKIHLLAGDYQLRVDK